MHVGLGLASTGGYAERVLLGIAAYARPGRDWIFDHGNQSPEGISRLLAEQLDGILFSSSDPTVFALIEEAGIPAVNAHFWVPPPSMGYVDSDDSQVGAMAADYFLNRGHTTFGYFARTGWPIDSRLTGFASRLETVGATASVFTGVPPSLARDVRDFDQGVREWLLKLPKPVAILCVNDHFALFLAERCQRLKLKVPEQVAILGVDNDPVICSLAEPPLSSVQTGTERIGFEAAKLLDQMMVGSPPSLKHIRVSPIRVISRRSTEVVVAPDKFVTGALRHMQLHLVDNLGLEALAERLHCSRRTLERRFQSCLGVSPAQAWNRFRLEEAQRLLADSDLKLPLVAELSGFREAKYLSGAFKKIFGQTPGQFRRHASPRASHFSYIDPHPAEAREL